MPLHRHTVDLGPIDVAERSVPIPLGLARFSFKSFSSMPSYESIEDSKSINVVGMELSSPFGLAWCSSALLLINATV